MIYLNDEFLEMEPNSPMVKLKPGELMNMKRFGH